MDPSNIVRGHTDLLRLKPSLSPIEAYDFDTLRRMAELAWQDTGFPTWKSVCDYFAGAAAALTHTHPEVGDQCLTIRDLAAYYSAREAARPPAPVRRAAVSPSTIRA